MNQYFETEKNKTKLLMNTDGKNVLTQAKERSLTIEKIKRGTHTVVTKTKVEMHKLTGQITF